MDDDASAAAACAQPSLAPDEAAAAAVTGGGTSRSAGNDAEPLRLAQEAAGIGTWDWDLASGAIHWSPEMYALHGLDPAHDAADTYGTWLRVLHPEDRERVDVLARRHARGGEPLAAEFRIVRPGGEVRWIMARGRTIRDAAGRPARMVGANLDVTDRKRAEAALRESEERYRTLVEMSPDAVYVHREGVIILANRQAAALFGAAAPEDLIGRRALEELVDPASRPLAQARTARLTRPGCRNELVELTMRRLDGTPVVTEAASAAVLLDGRLAVQAVLRDVTARKAGEAALRSGEEQLRLALEAAGQGVWDVDYASGRVRFDGHFARLYGLRADEAVTPEMLWEHIHPGDAPRLRAAVARAKDPASDGTYEVEYRVLGRDGVERWHSTRARVHFEGEGAARRPARFVGVLMDVTERRRIEAALRESEERYRATQDHASVGIAEVDAEGRFLRANAAITTITGYTGEELAGRSVFDVTHPEDAAAERAEFARLVSGESERYAREKRYLSKDGAERWVELAATAVRDAGGRFLYGVRVVQDVTDRKLAEARQELLLDELNHRVKNALAVVRGIALHSLDGRRTVEEARHVLEQRLGAMRAAYELLTAAEWRGAALRGLIAAELAPYGERIATEGPDVLLPPKAALSLGLVLHELATNALKHGALSVREGRVEVAWAVEEGQRLRLAWREAGGPEVAPPPRRGFGSLLIERSVAHNLGGTARLEFRREGLAYEVALPLDRG